MDWHVDGIPQQQSCFSRVYYLSLFAGQMAQADWILLHLYEGRWICSHFNIHELNWVFWEFSPVIRKHICWMPTVLTIWNVTQRQFKSNQTPVMSWWPVRSVPYLSSSVSWDVGSSLRTFQHFCYTFQVWIQDWISFQSAESVSPSVLKQTYICNNLVLNEKYQVLKPLSLLGPD